MTIPAPGGGTVADRSFLEACRNSPNVFIEYVLRVEQADVHERFQQLQTDHDDCYAELHRGLGKTTQNIARKCWDIGHDVNRRIKIVQATVDEAAKSVGLAKKIIESDRYREVFPNIHPDTDAWGATALRVKRDTLYRDPTLEACGIFGHAGGRCDELDFDDVCDLENAVRKPSLRQQVKEAYENTWLPMLTGDRKRVVRVGTPWHVDDITKGWRTECGDLGTLLRMPVVKYVSGFPAAFPPDVCRWWRKKLGPLGYARAFELKPLSGDVVVFPEEWLQAALYVPSDVPAWRKENCDVVGAVDWAYTVKKMAPSAGKADPDYSVMLIGRRTLDGHIYVDDMIRARQTYPEFKRRAIEIGQRRGFTVCRAESGGSQAGIVQQFTEDAPFPVEPVIRSKDKVTRATRCQPFVEGGRLHLRAEVDEDGTRSITRVLRPLWDEMVAFPLSEHDDCVDACLDLIEMCRVVGEASTDWDDDELGREFDPDDDPWTAQEEEWEYRPPRGEDSEDEGGGEFYGDLESDASQTVDPRSMMP